MVQTVARRAGGRLAGVAGALLLLALWTWLSSWTVPTRLPGPDAVLRVLVDSLVSSPVIQAQGGGSGGFLPHVWATFWHTVVAVAAGGVIGCALGWALATVEGLRWLLQPPIEVLRLVPSLVAVPFFVLWFGIGPVPQFALIVGYTVLVMQVAAYTAVRDFPPHVRRYAQTLGAGRWAVARTVLLPGALPGLLGSLRVTLQLAWGLAIVAELLGAQVGVGRVMSSAARLFRTDYVMAGVIWVSVVAMVTDAVFRWLIRRATAWSRT